MEEEYVENLEDLFCDENGSAVKIVLKVHFRFASNPDSLNFSFTNNFLLFEPA